MIGTLLGSARRTVVVLGSWLAVAALIGLTLWSDRAPDPVPASAPPQITRETGGLSADGGAYFGRVDNIVATLPGWNPTGSIVLTAHYDSVSAGPGVSDDGAAVAAILETVRATGAPLRNDLVLLITDAPPGDTDLSTLTADHDAIYFRFLRPRSLTPRRWPGRWRCSPCSRSPRWWRWPASDDC